MARALDLFHTSKLEKYEGCEEDVEALHIVINANGDEEHEVHRILYKANENRLIYYLVQFVREQKPDAKWIPKAELTHCKELIAGYERTTRTSC